MKMGTDCKMYRNTGTVGTPTWNIVDNVGSVSPTGGERDEIEVPLRVDGLTKGFVLGRRPVGYEFEMPQIDSDADQAAFITAHNAASSIDMAIMDGAIATTGSTGFRGSFLVSRAQRSEDIDKNVVWKFKIVPEAASGNLPAPYTVS